ncbi:hypothetical protein THOD03_20279 [Vibrio harveyi]|nr:hypothetical protein THOD03_20279 [Vibrio harveyi]
MLCYYLRLYVSLFQESCFLTGRLELFLNSNRSVTHLWIVCAIFVASVSYVSVKKPGEFTPDFMNHLLCFEIIFRPQISRPIKLT